MMLSASLILLLLVSGCKYDGSFLQMDSNSSGPFMGLQLSVDSGTRPGKTGRSDSEPASSAELHRLKPSVSERSGSAISPAGDHAAASTQQASERGPAAVKVPSIRPREADLVSLRLSAF